MQVMLSVLRLSFSHASTLRHRGEQQVCSHLLTFEKLELKVLESICVSILRVPQDGGWMDLVGPLVKHSG